MPSTGSTEAAQATRPSTWSRKVAGSRSRTWEVQPETVQLCSRARSAVRRRCAPTCRARSRARRGAELRVAELLASLRENVDTQWSPPGGGPLGALSHDVIHGLDATAALGIDDRHASPERCALVLSRLRPEQLRLFGVDLTGVRLQATDADWSSGSGDVVEGRAQDLLLAVCGRRQPAGRLTGAAADRLAAGSPN